MPDYKFVTIWKLDAPIERVYQAIHDTQEWPRWWSNIEAVERLEQGDSTGIGQVDRFTFRTELPYKVRFDLQVTRIEPPTLLEASASGELEGIGRWTFTQEGNLTVANYLWHVRTTRWWMNLLAPIARPFFTRNHDAVMARGGKSLAKLLNATLLHQEQIELDTSTSGVPAQPTTNLSG